MVAACDLTTPIGRRDRLLLVLGLALKGRRSELVALTREDVREVADGLEVTIRTSKTDKDSRGETIAIPRGSHPLTDPVAAWRNWLKVLDQAGHATGRLLLRVNRPLARRGRGQRRRPRPGHARPRAVRKHRHRAQAAAAPPSPTPPASRSPSSPNTAAGRPPHPSSCATSAPWTAGGTTPYATSDFDAPQAYPDQQQTALAQQSGKGTDQGDGDNAKAPPVLRRGPHLPTEAGRGIDMNGTSESARSVKPPAVTW